jgi:hypothetical protein
MLFRVASDVKDFIYPGLLDFVPKRLGKGRVQAIVWEEMEHIALLGKELGALQP